MKCYHPVVIAYSLLLTFTVFARSTSHYEHRTSNDPRGTGKFYMDREISQVMGHQGSSWLDRPERKMEENPQALLDSLEIIPGMIVADIGAGSGYFSFPLAKKVGPGGMVLAVDIQKQMLEIIRQRSAQQRVQNVIPLLGNSQDPGLSSESVDLAILVDVYHEFSHPWEMLRGIYSALKPGGRLVLVEYRGEDPRIPIARLHKMTEKQVRREITVHSLVWVKTLHLLPRQHIIIFQK